jgi:hypothetical protein
MIGVPSTSTTPFVSANAALSSLLSLPPDRLQLQAELDNIRTSFQHEKETGESSHIDCFRASVPPTTQSSPVSSSVCIFFTSTWGLVAWVITGEFFPQCL